MENLWSIWLKTMKYFPSNSCVHVSLFYRSKISLHYAEFSFECKIFMHARRFSSCSWWRKKCTDKNLCQDLNEKCLQLITFCALWMRTTVFKFVPIDDNNMLTYPYFVQLRFFEMHFQPLIFISVSWSVLSVLQNYVI